MKKLVLALLFVPLFTFASFTDLVEQQLENSSSYLSAILDYEEAEFNRSKNKNFFIPYVSVSNAGLETDISSTGDASSSFVAPFSITFENIAGFDVQISNAWYYYFSSNDWKEKGWSLTISRELFSNFDITELENEANFATASWNLLSAKNEVFLNLVEDIFNYHYYNQKMNITKQQIEILQDKFESLQKAYESGTASREDILEIQGNIYDMTQQLEEISQNLSSTLTEYSTDTLNTMIACLERITSNLPVMEEAEKFITSRLDLNAQILSAEIAKRQSERSYQQWIPNPELFFQVKQKDDDFAFSLGFSFGYDIIDRGEKDYNYKVINKKYELQKRVLDEKTDELKKALKNAYSSIKIAESSKKVAELDLQLKKMEYERLLKGSAFVAKTDLESARLDFEDAELELFKANYNLLIAKVNLLDILGFDLVQLAGGK
ncbi:TolC family protein [Pseudothermotoga elfii]|uniref:TolC family protein n=1 Tax=Pseudothermotoga elfii TaxID=38322 RepID=UPI000422AD99|nr:TolC family protein [Pseudothermotoga elfii]